MGLGERRGGGGAKEEEKVNDVSSLGFELNTLAWLELRGHVKIVTLSLFSTILRDRKLIFFFVCFNLMPARNTLLRPYQGSLGNGPR